MRGKIEKSTDFREIDPVLAQSCFDVSTRIAVLLMNVHVSVYGSGKFHWNNWKLCYLSTPMRQLTRIYKSHYFNGAAAAWDPG